MQNNEQSDLSNIADQASIPAMSNAAQLPNAPSPLGTPQPGNALQSPTTPVSRGDFIFVIGIILLGIFLCLAIIFGLPNIWITKSITLIGVCSGIIGILSFPRFRPALTRLEKYLHINIDKQKKHLWIGRIGQGIKQAFSHISSNTWRVIFILAWFAATLISTTSLIKAIPVDSSVVTTCKEGPDTFQVMRYNQEDIGISDSKGCYSFTSDLAESEIYSNNPSISESHITIIIATMLAQEDTSSYSAGRSLIQGAAIAQQEYNNHRKSGQLPLRLLIANTGTNEIAAQSVAEQIVQLVQKDPSIIGVMGWPFSTDQAKQALITLDKAHIPSVSPSLSSTQFDNISSYFFRIVPPDTYQGADGAAFLLQKEIKYVIVCEDPKNPYSNSLAESLQAGLESQKDMVASLSYTRGQLSQTGLPLQTFEGKLQKAINQARELFPENQIAVYFAGYASDFGYLRANLSTYSQVLAMGGDGLSEYSAYPNGDTNFYFTTFSDYQIWSSRKNVPQPCFTTQYQNDFNPNNETGNELIENDAVLAYDAMVALLSAYTTTNSSMPALSSMQKQLTAVNFLGVSGQVKMGPSEYPESKAVYVNYITQGSPMFTGKTYGDFLLGNISQKEVFLFCQ